MGVGRVLGWGVGAGKGWKGLGWCGDGAGRDMKVGWGGAGRGCSHNLFLWNPSIRKFKELPLSGSDVHSSSYMAMVLVIMSVKMILVEVMGILHSDYGFQNEFRIYSVRTNSWEMIQEYPVNETYENVELASLVDGNNDWELGTSGGNLCVFCDCHEVRMDVWVIKTYELVESWTKVRERVLFLVASA
ncbi:putative formin-A-like isoform X1 [Capsicum annuum]|nr:putative formin-A-like isoform X1 [Capsicum annuum]